MTTLQSTIPTLTLLVVAIAAACGGGEAGAHDASRFTVDTLPSGTVRVSNDGQGQWTPETAWRLEEELRLGTTDEEGPELFGNIAWIESDAGGRIYVLDGQALEVRVFAPDGTFARRFGGRGEGPGELTSATGMAWTPSGHLWIAPFNSGHHIVLDSTGSEVARHPRMGGGAVRPWSGGFTGDGRYIDWVGNRETTGRGATGQPILSGRTTYQPLAFTPPARYDTLPPLEHWHPVTGEGRLVSPVTSTRLKNPSLHVASDGIWFAMPDEYTIYKRALEGDTLLAFGIPGRPMPVPAAAVDSLIALRVSRGTPASREDFYSHDRLIVRVMTDGAGHVYVFPQEEGRPEGHAVDVFEATGVYLGRMHFPTPVVVEVTPPHVTPDHIYAVLQDALEVPRLARFRIVRP